MSTGTVGILIVFALALLVVVVVVAAASIRRRVGPHEALIISGRGATTYDDEGNLKMLGGRVVSAGGTLVIPVLEQAQRLDLRVMTIEQLGDTVITRPGVPVVVDWVAQLQINPTQTGIVTAARAFLGMTVSAIKEIATDALSGNFREVVATLTPEELLREKEQFAASVTDFAAPEMEKLGLQIISLNVREISDKVGYFENLGAPRIAAVRRDAKIAEAEADRDARVKAATARQEATRAELEVETRIAEATKERDVKQAQFRRESESQKAEADAAYGLREATTKRELAEKDGAVEVERQKQLAQAAEQSIEVAKKKQQAELVVPAEAKREAAIQTATGQAEATKLAAAADAEKTRLTKEAEAAGIRATGEATADADKARLLAQAEGTEAGLLAQAKGERELAQARAAEDKVNLQQQALTMYFETQVKIAASFAQAVGGIGSNMRVVQLGGALSTPGNGSTGNAMLDILMQFPELATIIAAKAEALSGKSVADILRDITAIVSGTQATEAQAALGEKVAEA